MSTKENKNAAQVELFKLIQKTGIVETGMTKVKINKLSGIV